MTARIASSRAIVDLNAYAHNMHAVRQMIPRDCGIIAVVKADAYGHGAVPIAKRAIAGGASMLAVATVPEAIELREAEIEVPVLLLMPPPDDALALVVEHRLRVMLSSIGPAEKLGELARRANKVVPLHCKIDTGMGRQGFGPDSAVGDLLNLTRISHVDIEAVCTHFAVAEDAKDPFTNQQIRLFKQLLKQVEKEGVPFESVHAANSGAIVNFGAAAAFDYVRPGLMTYGVWPSEEAPARNPLRPVLRWETQVMQVRNMPEGATIGYGRTYATKQRIWTAVLPVGYADGYPFSLGNKGQVLIRGKRCPVLGRVSMDQIVVDVTAVGGAAAGDTATLIGSDGTESIAVAEIAERAGTIPYDILTGIGRRVERVYIE